MSNDADTVGQYVQEILFQWTFSTVSTSIFLTHYLFSVSTVSKFVLRSVSGSVNSRLGPA